MEFKRYGEYIVGMNDEGISEDIGSFSEYKLYKEINLNQKIYNIDAIHKISYSCSSIIGSYLKDVCKYVNIIDVKINLRLEVEAGSNIKSNSIIIEKGELFYSSEVIRNIKIYINSISINIKSDEVINISIIYTLYI